MLLKKELLTQENLNNAYISKTDTNTQSVLSTLVVSGGAVTLKNSLITDNASASYLRISPQNNTMILYNGTANQQFSVYSSSGTESINIGTINAASNQSYGFIDQSGASVAELRINVTSGKPIKLGGKLYSEISTNSGVDNLFRNTNAGSSAYQALLLGNDTAYNKLLMFVNSSTRTADGGAGNSTIRTDSGKLFLSAGGGQLVTIDTNSRVGINNSSPSYMLDVNGSVRLGGFTAGTSDESGKFIIATGTNIDEQIVWGGTTRHVNSKDGMGLHFHSANAFSFFSTGMTRNWTIEHGGNVYQAGNLSVGTTTQSTRLTISYDSGTTLTGTGTYAGIHLLPSGVNDEFVGITTGSNNAGSLNANTQSGILFQGSSAYGTKIHFNTTDSHAAGMKQGMTLDHAGNLTMYRGNIYTPNTSDLGIKNVSADNFLYLDNGSNNTHFKNGKAGKGIFIDAETIYLRPISGASYLQADVNGIHIGSGLNLKTYGASGWKNETYGNGLMMSSTSWIGTIGTTSGLYWTRNAIVNDNGLYAQGHLQLATTDNSAVAIGFHRTGSSGVALFHDGDTSTPLKVRINNGWQASLAYAKHPASQAEINDATNLPSGFYTTAGLSLPGTNAPAGSWWHLINMRHHDGNGYGTQLAVPYYSTGNEIYMRGSDGAIWGSWKKVGGTSMGSLKTQPAVTYSTGSATYTTALNIAGSGVLKHFNAGSSSQVRITVDGTVVFTGGVNSSPSTFVINSSLNWYQGSSYDSVQNVSCDIYFKSSLLIEVYSSGFNGNSASISYVYAY